METHEDRVKREQINKENNSTFVTSKNSLLHTDYGMIITPKEDMVNHPPHYCNHPSRVECIDITRHYCFDIGNAIKYLWRAGLKKEEGMSDKSKEIEDLKKAIFYINDRIKMLENG